MNTKPETMLAELIRYNNWANQQVLEACQNLPEDQLARPIPGAYGTIRETLGHIISSEAGYIELLTGDQPQPPFKWDDQPSLVEMKAFAAEVGQAMEDMINRVRLTDRISEEWQGQQLHYKALVIFIEIVGHGIEHRTNITTMLNQEDLAPPEVDGWAYLLAHLDRLKPNGDD